jgi:hypothetical protein
LPALILATAGDVVEAAAVAAAVAGVEGAAVAAVAGVGLQLRQLRRRLPRLHPRRAAELQRQLRVAVERRLGRLARLLLKVALREAAALLRLQVGLWAVVVQRRERPAVLPLMLLARELALRELAAVDSPVLAAAVGRMRWGPVVVAAVWPTRWASAISATRVSRLEYLRQKPAAHRALLIQTFPIRQHSIRRLTVILRQRRLALGPKV